MAPGLVQYDVGHGRRKTRSIKVISTDEQPQLQALFPHAAQIAKGGGTEAGTDRGSRWEAGSAGRPDPDHRPRRHHGHHPVSAGTWLPQ